MKSTKFASLAALALALTFTFSCSGDDGDEVGGGGGNEQSCQAGSLDGVWEAGGGKTTVSGSTGVVSALPPDNNGVWKVGDQIWRNLTSTGNLTWSGQENVITEWVDVQLTMSADGQKLTVYYPGDGETFTMTRKCNNQSGGGSSSSAKGGSSSPSGGGDTYKDTRDGTTYKTKKIGNQTWLAENLNYDVPGNDTDVYYDNDPDKYKTYGRLYDWETAKTACPNDWRLPSDEDWDVLITAVGGEETAGKYLKAKSGWWSSDEFNGNGEDKFGFSALPGGYSLLVGSFNGVGNDGIWWSATDYDAYNAYSRRMMFYGDIVNSSTGGKSDLYSVRCVKD